MGSESRTTTVRILGNEYRLRSEENAAFVEDVARYVDEVMQGIAARTTSGTTAQIAVLGALNIAEELFRERLDGQGGGRAGEIDSRLKGLLSRVDDIIDDVPAPEEAQRESGAASG